MILFGIVTGSPSLSYSIKQVTFSPDSQYLPNIITYPLEAVYYTYIKS